MGIGLLNRNDPAGPCETEHFAEQFVITTGRRKDKANMYEIEAVSRQHGAVGITLDHLNVGQASILNVLARCCELPGVQIKTHDAPGRANPPAERPKNTHRATAEIEAVSTRLNPNLIEKRLSGRFPHPCL